MAYQTPKIPTSPTLEKRRKCPKCKLEKPLSEYLQTKSPFHANGTSLFCVDCLERMVDYKDLAAANKLMQWLDWPFSVELWTKLSRSGREHTLRLYAKQIGENPSYQSVDWQTMNERWKEAEADNTLQDFLDGADEQFMLKMQRKWPAEVERTIEDYHYLENFYNDLLATQNLVTATQRDDAKRLAEVGLLINQKIRRGFDAKKEMDMYHNIIKAEGFEPKNSKSLGSFDSVGEMFSWLEKRGKKLKFKTEPQDSVDFTLKQTQEFLRRLVQNEASIGDQVDDRKKQLELAEKLEASGSFEQIDTEEDAMRSIAYEDENVLEEDDYDLDALN